MGEIIRQFNVYAKENKSLIRKALSSATNVGEALIPQHLEEVITNTIVRLSPELALITPEFDNQKYHEFNRITALPAPGGAMGEAAVTPTRNSTYQRTGVNMKIVRRKGSVTNFLQDTSAKYIDASAAEMENHLLAHAYDLATYMMYGNAIGDQYTFSGLDKFISTNRINQVLGGVVPTTLEFMDEMLDRNLEYQGVNHRKCFLMSPRMLSKVSRLLTNVRLTQGVAGLGVVDVEGGWRLNAYRDIPIIVTNATRPRVTMGTVTATSGGTTTGTLSNGTYYFRVAPVTYNGEELASAEASVTLSGGTATQWISLAFTAVAGALYYKIYYGSVSGTTTLISIRSAFTYDGVGTITGNNTPLAVLSVAADTSVTGMTADVPLQATATVPPEYVILWDLDSYQGIGKVPYTNTAGSKFNGLVTVNPLAVIDDDLPFLIKTYAALVDSFEATCVINRGLRVA